MKIYTKRGDAGMTTLKSATQISKADDRIAALGTIDELTSHMGLAKAYIASMKVADSDACVAHFDRVQATLMNIMAGIADPRNKSYEVSAEETAFLEHIIDLVEDSFPREHQFIMPGYCELSARLDVARTVARRAERELVTMERKYSAHASAKAYLNRLSDYLYMLARRADHDEKLRREGKVVPLTASREGNSTDAVVNEVLRRIGGMATLDLKKAEVLIREIENYAASIGKKAVIAVCNDQGNPIAVHVMDDAFLVSYDVALKKAYTAVSVKMSTMELSALVQPGQTFYGLQNVDKMLVFGGGVPLKVGDRIVGGLGISGGTGEEDHALCEYGLQVFARL
jgi:cob(I)alamin adenosyltransferase